MRTQISNGVKGFYVYCIRPYLADVKTIKVKIGGFWGPIRTILFKDIEAVVSEIDPSKFNEKTVRDKLQEDAKWAEKNVTHHHEVVSQAYKIGAVIPMKFGTMFKTKKSLEAMLRGHYEKFKKLFSWLQDKQEWGVKMYLEYEKFVGFLKKQNKEVKKLEKRKLTIAEGMRWYVDRKIEESMAAQFEEELENQLQSVVKRLEDCCEQIVLCNLLPKEAMEAGKDNIFNAACLIDNNKLDDFKRLLQELEKEYGQIGGALIVTGPWPPYNFMQLKDAKKR